MFAMIYRIKEVDGDDEHIEDECRAMHLLTFGEFDAPFWPTSDGGDWWFVYHAGESIGFAGMVASESAPGYGYLCRAAVVPEHQGHGLQRRLIRVRETRAKRLGYLGLVTDTYISPESANNLIECGYRMYRPERRWAFSNSEYWRKVFK